MQKMHDCKDAGSKSSSGPRATQEAKAEEQFSAAVQCVVADDVFLSKPSISWRNAEF